MNTESCLPPVQGHPNVDESVTADNTLAWEKPSRNLPENLEWLRDAGMGLFIHWSLDVQLGCVISHTLVGASEEYASRFYEELPGTLHPRRWDFIFPRRISAIFAAGGCPSPGPRKRPMKKRFWTAIRLF